VTGEPRVDLIGHRVRVATDHPTQAIAKRQNMCPIYTFITHV